MKKTMLISLFLPSVAWAHQDHGITFMENIHHVLVHPEHAWPLIASAILVVLVAWVLHRP
ncbi:MAG: hypothetical protein COA90_07050 [Gammaproteobacteria bacterium]|nr:MAG: hypothetical protein COA90_07050 [Gammaproteobacteria bacterium]